MCRCAPQRATDNGRLAAGPKIDWGCKKGLLVQLPSAGPRREIATGGNSTPQALGWLAFWLACWLVCGFLIWLIYR